MTRLDLWPSRLHDVIEGASGRPFVWGEHDCCIFAAACVEAVTGVNPWPTRCPPYSTQRGARLSISACGYPDLPALLDGVLGPRRPILTARRGDVVLVPVGPDVAAAVIDLTGEFAVGPSSDGMVSVPFTMAIAAWSVG